MRSLRLIAFLMRESRGALVLMSAAGMVSGLLSVAVIALIGRALHPGVLPQTWIAAAFLGAVAGKIVSGALAQLLLSRFSQGAILDLSLALCARILAAPLRQLERHGSGRILAVLTEDVGAVTWAVQSLPQLATNLAVVLGCGVYLAWLSWQMFLWAAAVTVVGALIYKLIHERTLRFVREAREARSRLFGHFRTLTNGIKELMMHRGRREEFLRDELEPVAEDYRRSNLAATVREALAQAWIQLLLYGLIGILLFAYPAVYRPSPETITGYAFAILYLMGPLWNVIGALPPVMRGQVALQKIEELGLSLEACGDTGSAARTLAIPMHAEASVQLREIVFQYEPSSPGETPFTLGPLDFQLSPGELVFVVGGNGSGKSTFAKVLTGLYAPSRGEVILANDVVTSQTREAYREHFSAVFSDFHLFERLLGLAAPDLEDAARHYLKLLEIDHKVSLQDRGFSTIDLSQGQRKRLALLTAYLEDRPFYIFDEWAADQDPQYKHVFYSRLLPELRKRGKGVVVITHDDRYFSMGDRVIKLEQGKVSTETAHDLRSATGH